MKALTLPVILNPISRRKDKSVMLKFDTRELSPQETIALMQLEGSEGWLMYAPNEGGLSVKDIPEGNAHTETKSPSERLRSVLFVHFKQATESGKYLGIFDNFYKEQMDKIIEGYKSKNLHE